MAYLVEEFELPCLSTVQGQQQLVALEAVWQFRRRWHEARHVRRLGLQLFPLGRQAEERQRAKRAAAAAAVAEAVAAVADATGNFGPVRWQRFFDRAGPY